MPSRTIAVELQEDPHRSEPLLWKYGICTALKSLSRSRNVYFFDECTPSTELQSAVIAVAVYLAIVAVLRNRRTPWFAGTAAFTQLAVLHNLALSVVSGAMLLGASVAIIETALSTHDLRGTLCVPRGGTLPGAMKFWLYIFYASKFWEFLDTPLLIFRGRPLTLLHVWHHASVPLEVFAWLRFEMALGLYGMWFNTLVHFFMYAYFAMHLLNIRVSWKQTLTTLQIVQFCVSFAFLLPWFYLHVSTENGCEGGPALLLSACLNASYLLLFVDYYRRTYSNRSKEPAFKNE